MPRAAASLLIVLALGVPVGAHAFDPHELWAGWPEGRFVATPAPCLRPGELVERLEGLAARHPEGQRLEEVGRSAQGRPIHLLTLGRGARKVLLWSQMHGDEPSATPALLDIADHLLSRDGRDAAATRVLDELTLLMVPMLNPDGAEHYVRHNAQAIDINRDALALSTPEGRLLKGLRDTHEPELGFNLHDQNRRRTVGETGVVAAIAVLAVAGDPEGTVTPGRQRAKRASLAIGGALAPHLPVGIARYDDGFSPRAFGDNITAWGTPVVLVESGGLPPGRPYTDLTRLNFVGLLAALDGLARDDLAGYDEAVYDTLPENALGDWVDVVVRGGDLLQPGSPDPYRADLAFHQVRSDQEWAGCARGGGGPASRVVEVGDGRFLSAGREVDAAGLLVIPPLAARVAGWPARAWLTVETLGELARLGVGSVQWQVSERRLPAAREHARRLAGPARPALEVVSAAATPLWLELSGPPAPPVSDSLESVLSALRAPRGRGGAPPWPPEKLELLWGISPAARSWPPLRPGRAASFLLLEPRSPGEGGGPSALAGSRVVGVWLDGRELKPGAP